MASTISSSDSRVGSKRRLMVTSGAPSPIRTLALNGIHSQIGRAGRADLPVDGVDHLFERFTRRLEAALDGDQRRAVLDPDLGAERDPLPMALPELPALHEAVHAGAQMEG